MDKSFIINSLIKKLSDFELGNLYVVIDTELNKRGCKMPIKKKSKKIKMTKSPVFK
jgi:hypothetical protein